MDCKWWFPALPLLKYPDVRSATVLENPPFSSHIWNFLDGHVENKRNLAFFKDSFNCCHFYKRVETRKIIYITFVIEKSFRIGV